jgi:hypothetical protein
VDAARGIRRGIPIAAGVAGEHLVGQGEFAGLRVVAELELGVGKDQPARLGNRRGLGEDAQRGIPDRPGLVGAHQLHRALEADVLIVLAQLRLERRGVDRFGQPVAVAQALGKRDAADAPRGLVLQPARADQIAAHDRFDRMHLQLVHQHGALGDARGKMLTKRGMRGGEVVAHAEPAEPPQAQLGEQRALLGDAGLQHVVEGADSVRGDHEHAVGHGGRGVEVADLARVDMRPPQGFEASVTAGNPAGLRDHLSTRSAISVRYCEPSRWMRLMAS